MFQFQVSVIHIQHLPPSILISTLRCKNKYLEFNRQTVETTDYQRIKLTESESFSEHVTEESNSRIPRTVDIELRHSLVNTCIVGDVITVVGVVKAMQVFYILIYHVMMMLIICFLVEYVF
jgi:DNA replicative helicase MCM subunit Mcm2 (Cdc46/Mcm family)